MFQNLANINIIIGILILLNLVPPQDSVFTPGGPIRIINTVYGIFISNFSCRSNNAATNMNGNEIRTMCSLPGPGGGGGP